MRIRSRNAANNLKVRDNGYLTEMNPTSQLKVPSCLWTWPGAKAGKVKTGGFPPLVDACLRVKGDIVDADKGASLWQVKDSQIKANSGAITTLPDTVAVLAK